MNQHLYNTELFNRTLWYDGESSYHSANLTTLTQNGHNIRWVDVLTSDIQEYNELVEYDQQIRIKNTCAPLDNTWNLPDEYLNLDVVEYITNRHMDITSTIVDEKELFLRDKRLAVELSKYQGMKLLDILRAIIYIINTLTSQSIVWGVGRGSSVSSYVLYIIGVHDVDSFLYNLDINDFLHE